MIDRPQANILPVEKTGLQEKPRRDVVKECRRGGNGRNIVVQPLSTQKINDCLTNAYDSYAADH